jgi:hypothetical protein
MKKKGEKRGVRLLGGAEGNRKAKRRKEQGLEGAATPIATLLGSTFELTTSAMVRIALRINADAITKDLPLSTIASSPDTRASHRA